MTDKEIQAIVSSYVTETSGGAAEDHYEEYAGELATAFLGWLSERFEIVGKDKIRDGYAGAKYMYQRREQKIKGSGRFYLGQIKLLESLFPETLKSEEK